MLEKESPIWRPLLQMKNAPPPLKVKRAEGITLELEDGRKLINCVSSWWVTLHRHGHPKIAEAIYKQALTCELVNFSDFTHDPAEDLAKRLLSKLPASFTRLFFSDDGSTSVEIALKMACQYWHNCGVKTRRSFFRFEGGYHGDTLGGMSVGNDSVFHRPFLPLLFEVTTVPFPDTYEGDTAVEQKEQSALQAIEQSLRESPEKYAGIIIEPLIQAAAGMRICRNQFLKKLRDLANRHNLLLIYDEVMTGFGRTGDWFACTKSGIAPDILCLAKGLSGGFVPMAVTVCNEKIYQSFLDDTFEKAFAHSHSFTGSPLGCAAALASLDLLEENEESFRSLEQLHRAHLEKLRQHPKVDRVRCCGTIAAFDIVTKESTGYLNPVGKVMKERLMDKGFYFRPLGNSLYFMPAYCITQKELSGAYAAIESCLETI